MSHRQHCLISGCPNSVPNPGVRYFGVPNNENRALGWMRYCNDPKVFRLSLAQIRNRYSICERHFSDYQFQTTLKQKLNRGQDPTINLPHLDEDKKNCNKEEVFDEAPIIIKSAEEKLPMLRLVPVELMMNENGQQPKDESSIEDRENNFIPEYVPSHDHYVPLPLELMIGNDQFLTNSVNDDDHEDFSTGNVLSTTQPEPVNAHHYVSMDNLEAPSYTYENSQQFVNHEQDDADQFLIFEQPPGSAYIFSSVKTYKEGNSCEVCRICLKPLTNDGIKLFNEMDLSRSRDLMQMLTFVFPQLNLNVYPNPSICWRCKTMVEFSAELKLSWLKTEETLKKYIAGKPVSDTPINIVILPDDLKRVLMEHHSIIPLSDLEQSAINNKMAEEIENMGRLAQIIEEVKSIPQKLSPAKNNYGDPPYLCDMCGRFFQLLSKYKIHISNHKQKKITFRSFYCVQCNTIVKDCSKKRHLLCHRIPNYICEVCDRKFHLEHQLIKHFHSKHAMMTKMKQCHFCGKEISSNSFWRHQLLHYPQKKRHECHLCGIIFFWPYKLKRHLLDYHGSDSRTACPVCGKIIKYEYNLKKHIKIFHEQKVTKDSYCEHCKKSFYTKEAFRKHLFKMHDHNYQDDRENIQIVYND